MSQYVISDYLDKLIIPFNTNVNLFALNRDIIAHPILKELADRHNYKLKVYGRYFPENSNLIVSIYYAKQTCVKASITNFICQNYHYCLSEIIDQIENQLNSGQVYEGDEKIDAAIIKSYEGDNTMKKSMQEIEFEQFENTKKAEAEAEINEYKAKVDREIEQKRLALLEEQRMAKAHEEAAGYWYFYRGLLDSGFTEEQAMQILLAKEGK